MLGLEHIRALDQIYMGAQGPRWLRPVIHMLGFVGFAWLFVALEPHSISPRWQLAVIGACAIPIELINQVSRGLWRNGIQSAWLVKCISFWTVVVAGVAVYVGGGTSELEVPSPRTVVAESTFASLCGALLFSWWLTRYSLAPQFVWWLSLDPAWKPPLRSTGAGRGRRSSSEPQEE